MALAKDSLKDVQQLTFNPNNSPLDTVNSFYNYLKSRRLHDAFGLLSDNFKKGHGFNYWKSGYNNLLDTTVINSSTDQTDPNKINVKLSTKNLVGDQITTTYFAGYWDVKKVGDYLQLWDANINEVKNPDYSWFY